MTEQNPYAPVGMPGTIPPPGVGMVPPQGFAPPPVNGFAPAPMQSFDHPAMTLTELSYAPVASDAPPAPMEVPSPPVGSGLVTSVLPSGGGVGRKISLGGRTPLVALLLVLLLGGAGVYFGTDLLKAKDEPAAPILKKQSASTAPKIAALVPAKPNAAAKPKPAAKKPAAKPVVAPLAGKPLAVTAANSRTYGGGYTVTQPTGWTSNLKNTRGAGLNTDLRLTDPKKLQMLELVSVRSSTSKGPLTPSSVAALRAKLLKASPAAKVLPGVVTATVAGTKAMGFDASVPAAEGQLFTQRTIIFEHNGAVHLAIWGRSAPEFSKSLATFNQLLASVTFAK